MLSLADISAAGWVVFALLHVGSILGSLLVRPLSRIATQNLQGYSATAWTIPPVWVGVWNGILERLLVAGVTFFSPPDVALVAVAWIALKTAVGWRGIWGDDMARRVRGVIGLWASIASVLIGIGSGVWLRSAA